MVMRCLLQFVALMGPMLASPAEIRPQGMGVPATALQHHVVFTAYTPFSRSTELARRLMTPLNAALLQRESTRSGRSLREQPLDLTHEEFVVYVPSALPPGFDAGGSFFHHEAPAALFMRLPPRREPKRRAQECAVLSSCSAWVIDRRTRRS